jgi:hypothetical protein
LERVTQGHIKEHGITGYKKMIGSIPGIYPPDPPSLGDMVP